MVDELEEIRGQRSAHSFATGPVTAEPFISPLLLTITPALSSKYRKVPSRLRKALDCRTTTAGWTLQVFVRNEEEKERNLCLHWLVGSGKTVNTWLPSFGVLAFLSSRRPWRDLLIRRLGVGSIDPWCPEKIRSDYLIQWRISEDLRQRRWRRETWRQCYQRSS